MQHYRHLPLQGHRTIRLLQLEPTKSLAASVQCTLQEVSLDANPRYEAISYSWDGQQSDQEVLCAGKPLLVTRNAALVLRHLREPRQPRWVWIDSICINQNDVQEKTGQVRMMREIYSRAIEVLLWIGESTKTSGRVFRSITNKAKLEVQRRNRKQFDIPSAVVESDLFRDFLVMFVVKPIVHCVGMVSGKRAIRKEALSSNIVMGNKGVATTSSDQQSEILSHAIFERIWCVQEIALGQSVRIVCGKQSVPLEDFEFQLNSMETLMRTMDQSVKFKIHKARLAIHHNLRVAIQAARHPQAGKTAAWPPVSVLLDLARKKGATHTKDKIFALAGIFSFMNVNISPPDYTAQAWQVYREATIAAIQYDRNLDVLYQVTGLNKTESLPSWVPDYGNTSSPILDAHEFANASGNSQTRWRFDLATGDLCIMGHAIDSISERSAALLFEPTNDLPAKETRINAISPSTIQVFKDWASRAIQFSDYPTRESPTEVFARTLCTSAAQHGNFAIKDFIKVFPKWLELINEPDPATSLVDAMSDTPSRYSYESSHKSPEQRAYSRELLAAGLGPSIGMGTIGAERRAKWLHFWLYLQCEQKSLFVTKNGYLGIGPHSVGVGDLVVLFSGLKVPFVVRRVATSWMLVAPVYIHGIMQGEGWNDRRGMEEFQLA